MKARQSLETAGATLLSAFALVAPASPAHAANQLNPNQNPTNRLAKRFVKNLGGQLLRMTAYAGQNETVSKAVTVGSSGAANIEVTIDTRQSLVSGSNGKYVFQAFTDKVGRSGLDAGDINNVSVAEGSAPSDGRPLFALRLSSPHPHATGISEGGARGWYGADGTAIEHSGKRVDFDGGIDPSRFATPPGLVLDRTEVQAAGQSMNMVVQAALDGQPTQLEIPPFGPLQPEP